MKKLAMLTIIILLTNRTLQAMEMSLSQTQEILESPTRPHFLFWKSSWYNFFSTASYGYGTTRSLAGLANVIRGCISYGMGNKNHAEQVWIKAVPDLAIGMTFLLLTNNIHNYVKNNYMRSEHYKGTVFTEEIKSFYANPYARIAIRRTMQEFQTCGFFCGMLSGHIVIEQEREILRLPHHFAYHF